MPPRTLLLAVDGLDEAEHRALVTGLHPALRATLGTLPATLRILPGGPSEPAPSLTGLVTGTTVAHTGVPTQLPFRPREQDGPAAWDATALRVPTLFEAAEAAGLPVAALQWPATAGSALSWNLPLVEDLRRYGTRWAMAEATSSPRMVREHLAPRRQAGVQLSRIAPDDLVAEIAAALLTRPEPPALTAVHLTGLGRARREAPAGSTAVRRAREDLAGALERILAALDPGPQDRLLLVPGRPLVPTTLLAHPNALLAARSLIRTDGPRLADYRAVVWPDGPHGALHVRRGEGEAVRRLAVDALRPLTERREITLRPVEDGAGATTGTDVIAVLDGAPGTRFDLPVAHRPLVEGDDPYSAGPLAVADPQATTLVRALGAGLPDGAEGSWADLGVSLAAAMGLRLPGACAAGMRQAAARAG